MFEKIEIENFLVIKKVEFEVKKVNIIIGRQAQGKSVIAKLSYFFSNLSDNFVDGIRDFLQKKDLDAKILERFESYFPRYAWEGSEFTIKYKIGEIEITVEGVKQSKNRTKLKLSYSSRLANMYAAKKKVYKRKLDELSVRDLRASKYKFAQSESMIFYEHVLNPILDGDLSYFFGSSVFIPASRTFFANLQKNIFTFLASNIDIDPFIKEFGSVYENSKKMYASPVIKRARNNRGTVINELDRAIENIVGGEYEYSNDQDWIVSKRFKVNLANASSGQQEAMPMLLLLAVWPHLYRNRDVAGSLYIEEPEAHLFPDSQSRLVSLFSLLTENSNCRFFITTHSPYILSALNNLVLAGEAISKGNMTKEDLLGINGVCEPLMFNDVSAYTMNKGSLIDIKDYENNMVGGEILDQVSEHFESVVDFILSSESAE